MRDPRTETQTPFLMTQPAFIYPRKTTLSCIKLCLLRSRAPQPSSLWDRAPGSLSPPCAQRSAECSRGERRGQHRPVLGKGCISGKVCSPKAAGSSGISGHAHTGEQDSCELHFVNINERNAKSSLCFGDKRCGDASSSELDP